MNNIRVGIKLIRLGISKIFSRYTISKKPIKLFVFDVDGTYSDGKVHWSSSGDEIIAFHARDTYGLLKLIQLGLSVVAISGRTSQAVHTRLNNLKIDKMLGCSDKFSAICELSQKLEIGIDEVAFVGDDIIDVLALKECGVSFAPANAHPEVLAVVDVVVKSNAGEGAIRDTVDHIMQINGLDTIGYDAQA